MKQELQRAFDEGEADVRAGLNPRERRRSGESLAQFAAYCGGAAKARGEGESKPNLLDILSAACADRGAFVSRGGAIFDRLEETGKAYLMVQFGHDFYHVHITKGEYLNLGESEPKDMICLGCALAQKGKEGDRCRICGGRLLADV